MSKLARELLGMTDAQIHNTDFRTIRSSREINISCACRDIRLSRGMIVCPEDLNEERKALCRLPRRFR